MSLARCYPARVQRSYAADPRVRRPAMTRPFFLMLPGSKYSRLSHIRNSIHVRNPDDRGPGWFLNLAAATPNFLALPPLGGPEPAALLRAAQCGRRGGSLWLAPGRGFFWPFQVFTPGN